MTMEFEIVAHDIGGVGVKFVLPKHAHDSYLDALRRAPIPFSLMGYFGHIEQRLNRKLRVVDVGANLGTIALPLAVRGNDVLAIEAELQNFACLVTACEINRLKNLRPVHIAVHERPTIVYLEGGSAWGQTRIESTTGMPVFGLPLASILRVYDYESVDVIKIDVEGAELSALTNVETLLDVNDKVDFIYESNSTACHARGYTPQRLAARFESLGYKIYSFVDDHLMEFDSTRPQGHVVCDNLATKRPVSELSFLPVRPFSYEFAELELRRAANRKTSSQYRHALRQGEFCRAEFTNGHLWKQSLEIIDESIRSEVSH